MYENMVRELRNAADEWRANHLTVSTFETRYDLALLDAADAIEELDALLDGVSADNDALCETIERMKKPRWIPVAETPPLKVGDDGYNGYLVYANGYYEVADYTTDKLDNVPYFHVDGEYEPNATHWMPLPTPPKPKEKT